jgi:hypothetical protein
MTINRLIIPLTILVFLLASCGQKKDTTFHLDNKNGEWRIDSVAGLKNYYKTDYIYIIDSKWWRICRDTCPMLIDSCLTIKNDSVFSQNQLKYIVTAKDSSTLVIKNFADKDFFVRCMTQVPTEYSQYLSEYLKGDSLIRHLAGWWQLTSPTDVEFHLPNNSDARKIHKLHLDKNGDANFYFFTHKDSSEHYRWTVKPNAIDFARGCIPESNTEIISLNENELKILMRLNFDTLVFKRSVPIK